LGKFLEKFLEKFLGLLEARRRCEAFLEALTDHLPLTNLSK
jgi:hypothetical protein